MKILMVCLGNICRSPIAEGVLQKKAKENGLNWIIDSAGTNGYHIGEAPHRFSQKICKQHGIDISRQRARYFLSKDIEEYDLIYALAEDVYQEIKKICGPNAPMHKVKIFLSELNEGSTESVPDPWYGDESGYLPVYQIIDKTCDVIIEKALSS
ncbi:MAG: low molecular weight protein-tyrosine-phosphatase [Bacteroidota bacterium]